MRFPVAWAQVAAQNVNLKFAVAALSVTSIGLAISCTKLALKPPLLIERTCYSSAVATASIKHTSAEIEAFLRDALGQRFDTDSIIRDGFISIEESKFKPQEQADLKRREMRQQIIVGHVTAINDSTVGIDTDRLVSLGQVKSIFPFPLEIKISKTQRSESNPYGLMIEKISAKQAPSVTASPPPLGGPPREDSKR